MKHRDRQLAAIRHELPDRIAVDVQAIENGPAIAEFVGCDEEDVRRHLGVDGRTVGLPYAGEPRTTQEGLELSPWGAPTHGDWGTAHAYPLAGADSVQRVEAHAWPDPDDYDYRAAGADARHWHDEYATRGPRFAGFFSQACYLLGMEEALTAMITRPAVFEATIDHAFQIIHEQSQRYVEACGENLDCYCIWDDFATQRGLMFDPLLWRRFLKPRYAELFDIGRRAGKFVWFHSCADITAVLPDLVDIGMDVWEAVQLHTFPMSARKLKSEYGKHITFFGGINTQRLPFAGPTEVSDEVRRCIEDLGRDGGFICGPDHHIKPDVPAQNALTLFQAARDFRRSGYTAD